MIPLNDAIARIMQDGWARMKSQDQDNTPFGKMYAFNNSKGNLLLLFKHNDEWQKIIATYSNPEPAFPATTVEDGVTVGSFDL